MVFVALGASGVSGKSPGYIIIVHPENPVREVDRSFLQNAFLKRTVQWPNNDTIRPVDLAPDFPVREQFSREVLKRGTSEVRNYWHQQIFSGKSVPPPELESEADVIAYVLRNAAAIGYLSADSNPRGARVIPIK